MGIEVKIMKWDKYQPRQDLKHPTWFRLNHSLFEDPDFFGFSHLEINFWVYLLSLASKKNEATFTLNPAHAERIGRFSHRDIEKGLFKLQNLGIVKVKITADEQDLDVTCTGDEQEMDSTIQTDKQTDNSAVVKPPARKRTKVFFENASQLKEQLTSNMPEWTELYPDPGYIDREITKAFGWYKNNKQKCPTTLAGWNRAIASWLERGWPKHIASVPTGQGKPTRKLIDDEREM
jgi:hypothetical protein